MADIYDDLANALSETIIGLPYDPASNHPERYKIDSLVEMAEDYGFADVSLPALQYAYAPTGFDITQWIGDRIKAGDLDTPDMEAL